MLNPSIKLSSQSSPPISSFFWSSLKHPAHSASLPPKPNSLTSHQVQIYEQILDHFNQSNLALPHSLHDLKSNAFTSRSTLSDLERCYCSRESILRVCRASRWDQTSAIRRLEETLVWRREFGVNEIDEELMSKEVSSCFLSWGSWAFNWFYPSLLFFKKKSETGKQFVLGYDVHSRPCLHMYPYRQVESSWSHSQTHHPLTSIPFYFIYLFINLNLELTNTSSSQRILNLQWIKSSLWYGVWNEPLISCHLASNLLRFSLTLVLPRLDPVNVGHLHFFLIFSISLSSPWLWLFISATTLSQAKQVLDILQTYYCERKLIMRYLKRLNPSGVLFSFFWSTPDPW